MERDFVMLTFDLEEFDIPQEYGQPVPEIDQMRVTLRGMEAVMSVLDKHNVRATFFTTGHFAAENPELVRDLARKHEIASHALYHAPTHAMGEHDIRESRRILESISGQTVNGFRMPRLKPFDRAALHREGFRYDSSVNPTWLPGRYNLLAESPLPGMRAGLIELPCSTAPWTRFPLFWLSFKNLPLSIYTALCRLTLKKRGNLMLYFHPWEFADLSGYKLPMYVKRCDGTQLAARMDTLICSLKKQNAEFVRCNAFCDYWEGEKIGLGPKDFK